MVADQTFLSVYSNFTPIKESFIILDMDNVLKNKSKYSENRHIPMLRSRIFKNRGFADLSAEAACAAIQCF